MNPDEQCAIALERPKPAAVQADIESKIREFVARNLLFSEAEFPHPDQASFLQSGVIDSLGVLELVSYAAQEFRIQVEPAEVTPDNFDSVARLAAYIRRKQVPGMEDRCVSA